MIFFNSLSAQPGKALTAKQWALGINFLISQQCIVDKSFSLIPYSGLAAGGSVCFAYDSKRVSHEIALAYVYGNLAASYSSAGSLQNNYANVDYTFFSKLRATDESYLNCKVGGSVNILYGNRKYKSFINKNTNFEFASSLSGSLQASHYFKKLFHGFSISNQLTFPLISYVEQPSYGAESASDKKSFNSKSIVNFPSFLRIKNRFSIEKVIKAQQKFSINYTWDYYHITQLRNVNSANHCIGLTYYHIL